MGSFALSLSYILFTWCIYSLDVSHSALPISLGIFTSPSFHFLYISYAIRCTPHPLFFYSICTPPPPPSISSHSILCILCALCHTCCHSSFLLLWGIQASSYFHILRILCAYLPYAPLLTTASAGTPRHLSFLHVSLSFFQLSFNMPTFNFFSSVVFH